MTWYSLCDLLPQQQFHHFIVFFLAFACPVQDSFTIFVHHTWICGMRNISRILSSVLAFTYLYSNYILLVSFLLNLVACCLYIYACYLIPINKTAINYVSAASFLPMLQARKMVTDGWACHQI